MANHSRNPKNSAKTGWPARLVAVTVVAIVGAAVTVLTIAGSGMVTGEEFSPDTFQRRSFVYYQIPLLRFQITPVFRDKTTNRLELHLSNNSLVPQAPPDGSRWDVVRAVGASTGHWRGDACILCNYLDQQNEKGEYVWLEWTKDHSDLAQRLWPTVAQAARSRLYEAVPDLMRLAETVDDPDQLAQQLHSLLVDEYVWHGQKRQQMEQHARALSYLSEALTLDGDSAEALRGRVQSYEALGQKEAAAADLRRLRALDKSADP